MATITTPSKEQVRAWAQTRRADRQPLPSTEEIRRQLGWHLLVENKPPKGRIP